MVLVKPIMALPFIAESAASAIIGNLVSTCFSYLEVYPTSGMQDELERLQRTLWQVQAVLIAVEGGVPVTEENKALETWLWQFRDAVENAEDVLDELESYKLKKTIEEARDDKDYFYLFWIMQELAVRVDRHLEYIW